MRGIYGKLVHNVSNGATLTLAAGNYAVEAALAVATVSPSASGRSSARGDSRLWREPPPLPGEGFSMDSFRYYVY